MHKLRQALTHAPRHSTIAAYAALLLSVTGTAYAAVNLPAGSVGTRELRTAAVTPAKLDANRIGAYVRAWAVITGNGHVLASRPRAHTDHFAGGGGNVSWGLRPQAGCFELTSTNQDLNAGAVNIIGGPHKVAITAFASNGHPTAETVAVAVLCAPR